MTAHTLVLATTNAGKIRELEAAFTGAAGLTLRTLREWPELPAVVEDGDSFAANASLKARGYAQATGLPCLADDSGLCIDALAGAPGVHSARFAGPKASDADNRHKVLAALDGRPNAERRARMCCVLAWTGPKPGAALHLFEGVVQGHIATRERGDGGFGYDPIFIPEGETQSFAELPAAHKQAHSHRAQALAQLRQALQGLLD
ncbi:MAG: RdgB/HAM1 family non-canonical purine NTP pyrophosphatase [Polyangiales bacterium]